MVVVRPPAASQPAESASAAFKKNANALGEIVEALARAKPENRCVLIVWGSNAGTGCLRFVAALKAGSEVQRILLYEYELVLVNVGDHINLNIDTAASYGAIVQRTGVPYLTVLGASQQPLVNVHADYFSDGRGGYDSAKLQMFLRNFQAMSPLADDVLRDGLKAAKTNGQLVLLQFAAPASERSRQIDAWFVREVGASISGAARVRIDVERTIRGRDVLRRYSGEWRTTAPWFVLVNAQTGVTRATSVDAEGNSWGALDTPAAIMQFRAMLRKAGTPLTDEQLDALLAPLLPTKAQ